MRRFQSLCPPAAHFCREVFPPVFLAGQLVDCGPSCCERTPMCVAVVDAALDHTVCLGWIHYCSYRVVTASDQKNPPVRCVKNVDAHRFSQSNNRNHMAHAKMPWLALPCVNNRQLFCAKNGSGRLIRKVEDCALPLHLGHLRSEDRQPPSRRARTCATCMTLGLHVTVA